MTLPFTGSGHREPATEHAARGSAAAGQATPHVIAVNRVAVAVEDEVAQQGDDHELPLQDGTPGAASGGWPVVSVPQVRVDGENGLRPVHQDRTLVGWHELQVPLDAAVLDPEGELIDPGGIAVRLAQRPVEVDLETAAALGEIGQLQLAPVRPVDTRDLGQVTGARQASRQRVGDLDRAALAAGENGERYPSAAPAVRLDTPALPVRAVVAVVMHAGVA